MTVENMPIAEGLHLVAVPIGNARDITLRALDVLANADVLAAEDTRSLRRLMDIHGIPLGDRPLIGYHDHNGPKIRPRLLALLAEGKSIAYASEAGTPLVADPGFVLVRDATEAGHLVTTAPGVSAAIAALSIAGLPSDRFLFAGFMPNAKAARKRALSELSELQATLIFYESPKRLGAFLSDAAEVFGKHRTGAVCRELTKKFEEVRRGTLDLLKTQYTAAPPKGEIVILIDRAGERTVSDSLVNEALTSALRDMRTREAADYVAQALGIARRDAYQAALALKKDEK